MTDDPSEPRRLADILRDAIADGGHRNLNDLTVLAPQHDPYRQATPDRLIAGEWLAGHASRILQNLLRRQLHVRGFHYALLGVPKPDGVPYATTDKDWEWLQGFAADGARWTGMLPFEAIV